MRKTFKKINLQLFAMKNLDLIKQQNVAILQKMQDAVKNDDAEGFSKAFTEFANALQDAILQDVKNLIVTNDSAILAQRGVRQLTSEETEYYQKLIEAMRSKDPKQAVTLIDDVMPKTIIDEIFAYLTENHPLLDAIDFQNTGAIVQWIMSTTSGVAGWGELDSTISDELSGAFSVIELGKVKLSAYIPIANAMLDLGPAWLDTYIRTLLAEAIAVGLEAGIVDGDGDNKPLGMTRQLSGAVDGVYPRKDAIAITAFDPETYGSILEILSKAPNNKRRAINSVILVVNPADYFTKVFPATTPRATDGRYINNVFPYPTEVFQSTAVPSGYAVMGLGNRYFMGLGTGTGRGGKIEYSDEYKFLEDQRIYRVKFYGNGRPKDENAFVYLDISNLEPTVLQVKVVNSSESTVTEA